MGRVQAARVAAQVHLDTVVRIQRPATDDLPTLDVKVWASVTEGGELAINRAGSLALPKATLTIRYEQRFTDVDERRLFVTLPDAGRETVTNVVSIGRERFLKLEVDY